jgi:hypothetical protein
MPATTIIPDRGEFIDALKQLRRGRLLVHSDDGGDERCVIEGSVLYTAFRPLQHYGLLDELPAPRGRSRLHCFRLSPRGRDFADRACAQWRRRPWLERLAVRLTG